MKLIIEPTEELWTGLFNGVAVPCRIWKGSATSECEAEPPVAVEAYVIAIVPLGADDKSFEALKRIRPEFMKDAREAFDSIEEE